MAGDETTPREWADRSSEMLSALGSRLEDRGHDDSPELVAAVAARAIADALREVAHELRAIRFDTSQLSHSGVNIEAHAQRMAKAMDAGLL